MDAHELAVVLLIECILLWVDKTVGFLSALGYDESFLIQFL